MKMLIRPKRDTNRILDDEQLAVVAHQIGVEVVDEAQAVAAQHQRVGIAAQAVFARIECVFQAMRTARIPCGWSKSSNRNPSR